MTYRDVYLGALILTGGYPASASAKYEEAAKRLIPMTVTSLLPLDRIVKRNAGEEPAPPPEPVISLDDEFPLPSEFMPAACLHLASELCAAEDPETSTLLYVRSEAEKRILSDAIPYVLEEL